MGKEFDNVNRPKHYQIKIGDHDFEMYEVIRSFVCKYPIEDEATHSRDFSHELVATYVEENI